jgi:hypothetical protein
VTTDAFNRLVSALSLVAFGDFDMIFKYFGNSTKDLERLDDLNVTFLMTEVWLCSVNLCESEPRCIAVNTHTHPLPAVLPSDLGLSNFHDGCLRFFSVVFVCLH